MALKSVAVTASAATGLKFYLSGWYFTNTDSTVSHTITVAIKAVDSSGSILWQITLNGGDSVGETLPEPIDLRKYGSTGGCYVSVTGTGTCQGAVRGR